MTSTSEMDLVSKWGSGWGWVWCQCAPVLWLFFLSVGGAWAVVSATQHDGWSVLFWLVVALCQAHAAVHSMMRLVTVVWACGQREAFQAVVDVLRDDT